MNLAIIFDMDGVIIKNSEFQSRAWDEFCKKYGVALTESQKKQYVYGRINKETLEYIFERELTKAEADSFGSEKEEIYRSLYKPHLKLTENLKEFLEFLKSNEIIIGIATSANRENVDFVLDGTGIRKYFAEIVDADQITKGKPDPEIYRKAAERLGVKPRNCLVIEDAVPGILAGKNAGMKVIAITTTHTREELHMADVVIDDFGELCDIKKLSTIF